MQGNYKYVIEAYKQSLNFEKLFYLFILTGNYPMLNKLMDISKNKDDKMMCYNIALFTGNIQERINILKSVGQHGLAYLTAYSNGLHDIAKEIKLEIEKLNINKDEKKR